MNILVLMKLFRKAKKRNKTNRKEDQFKRKSMQREKIEFWVILTILSAQGYGERFVEQTKKRKNFQRI